MFKEKATKIIASLVLAFLSLILIPISNATTSVPDNPQYTLHVTTEQSPKNTTPKWDEIKEILEATPQIPRLPKLIPPPKTDTSEKNSLTPNIDTSAEQQNHCDTTSYEYYKKRADNWKIKDVANVEPITTLTAEEISLLERLVECELTGNSQELYYGKLAIANALLNRYRTDYWEFPDTIKEIVYQKNQFAPAFNGMIDNITVTELTKTVVKDALDGKMIIEPNVYYFCTLDADGKDWFENRLEFYGHFSGHDFYSLK